MAPPSNDLSGSDEVPCGDSGIKMEMKMDRDETKASLSDNNYIVGDKDDVRLPTPAVVGGVNAAAGLGVAGTAGIVTHVRTNTTESSPGASSSLLSSSDDEIGAEKDEPRQHEQIRMATEQEQFECESTDSTGLESEKEDCVVVNDDNKPSIHKMDSTVKLRDESNSENNAPSLIDYARRGAVGAVGGTMTLIGLVMIPLPTPFGAVIASSGLAVLGTEFKGAKELNDRLIEGAKQSVHHAREYMVQSLESMEDEEFDADKHQSTSVSVVQTNTDKKDGNVANTDDPNEIAKDDEPKTSNSDKSEESEGPKWLHMNQVERERQARLAQEKYKQEKVTNYQSTAEYLTKKTGLSSFLTRTVLPVLKGKDKGNRGTLQQDGSALANNDRKMIVGSSLVEDDGFVMVEDEGAMGSEALVNPDVLGGDR